MKMVVLEQAQYNPQKGKPLDSKEVGREEWHWHQFQKAGAALEKEQEKRPRHTERVSR